MSPTEGPEELFKRGLEAMTLGKVAEASSFFHRAMSVERIQGNVKRRPAYRSYYALCQSQVHGPTPETISLCEEAVEADIDPALQLNLVRVYLLAGMKTKALATLEGSLRLYPRNRRFLALRAKIDRRAKPPVPLFGRNHPINRFLARLRR
jgi:tetratricopeptide (TPR) repeat protein